MTLSVTVTLGEVATFIRGITFKPEDVVPMGTENSVVCLRTKNVQTELDLRDIWAVDRSLVRRADQFLQAGDILISSANSWNLVGKCSWIPELPWKTSFGGFVSVLRANPEKIFPRFLFWWFSSTRIQAMARSFGNKTTNISNLNVDRCLGLSLRLPSLQEQKRIAAILDQVEYLRVVRRITLDRIDSMSHVAFNEAFGDILVNDRNWDDSKELGDCAEIVSGFTKGRKLDGKLTFTVPYLAVANVQDKFLRMDSVKSDEATQGEIERYRLIGGDLLLTEGGDPDKLGRGTLWNNELPVCIHQNHVFRVRLVTDELTPVFLNWLVGSVRGKRYFLKSAKQTTGIASINMSQLKKFPLLIPPLSLQKKFELSIAKIERAKKIQKKHLSELDALFASLQHRAFRGEL